MSVFRYTAGLRNAGSYRVSGTPFVTASSLPDGVETQIDFPKVTNNITVQMDSGKVVRKGVKIGGDFALIQSTDTSDFPDGQAQTYVFWIRLDSALASDSDWRYIFDSPGSAFRAHQLRYKYSTDKIKFQAFEADGGNYAADVTSGLKGASSEYPLQHIMVVCDGNTSSKFYVNNVEKASHTLDSDIQKFTKVRYSSTVTNDGGNAVYVESGFFNVAFTSAQRAEAYNSGKYLNLLNHSKAGNLKIYHTFGNDPRDVITSTTATINDVVGINSLATETGVGGSDQFTLTEQTFNSGPNLRVHFNSTGSDAFVETRKHYWNLDTQDDELSLHVKTKSIYLSCDGGTSNFTVSADLTSIPTGSMYKLTGSGIDE
jgi:hypothetical protein